MKFCRVCGKGGGAVMGQEHIKLKDKRQITQMMKRQTNERIMSILTKEGKRQKNGEKS